MKIIYIFFFLKSGLKSISNTSVNLSGFLGIRCRTLNFPQSVCKTQPDLTKPGKKTMLGGMPSFSLAPICDDSQQDHMVSLCLNSFFLRTPVSRSLHYSLQHQEVQRKVRRMESRGPDGDVENTFSSPLTCRKLINHTVLW